MLQRVLNYSHLQQQQNYQAPPGLDLRLIRLPLNVQQRHLEAIRDPHLHNPRLPSLGLTINHKGFVAVNQTGEDMDLATHREAAPVAPNLWSPAQVRVLRQKTGTTKS